MIMTAAFVKQIIGQHMQHKTQPAISEITMPTNPTISAAKRQITMPTNSMTFFSKELCSWASDNDNAGNWPKYSSSEQHWFSWLMQQKESIPLQAVILEMGQSPSSVSLELDIMADSARAAIKIIKMAACQLHFIVTVII